MRERRSEKGKGEAVTSFLSFLGILGPALVDLFKYVTEEAPDAEREKQLAADIIRRASDARMRQELGG